MRYFTLILISFFSSFGFSQFQFNFTDSIPIFKNGIELILPWAGGLNYAQVSDIDYDFDGKYLVSLYGRRDGSSLLGKNNKYEFAKGASIGWNLTKESFMSNVKWLNILKLKAIDNLLLILY